MVVSPQFYPEEKNGLASALLRGIFVLGLAFARRRPTRLEAAEGAEAVAAGLATAGAEGAGAERAGAERTGLITPSAAPTSPPAKPAKSRDSRHKKCLWKRSGVLPDPELSEYAFALAKADRYQEAIDVLDTLQIPIRRGP